MPRIHSHVPGDPSPFGSVGQHAVFARAVSLYQKDRLDDAFKAMLELGAGVVGEMIPTYRMIEAEYLTRQRATVRDLSPVVRLELIAGTVDENAAKTILAVARDSASERLGIAWNSIVHATILDESVNAPWAPGRHGYCTPKDGFAKVCLPHYLTLNEGELASAFRHELAHALAHQETDGSCATWLNEAIAMQIGGEPLDSAREFFGSRKPLWIDPESLSLAFKRPRNTDREQQAATVAYWQAALIGSFIAQEHGERTLGVLLKAHRLGFADQLKAAIRGTDPTEIAISKVLHLPVQRLFDEVQASL